MTVKKIVDSFNIGDNLIDCDISYRGGTVKVNVSELFPEVSKPTMGAYQNYLGGGIAGSIVGAAMFEPSELKTKKDRAIFFALKEKIKKFFFEQNNGGGDEYMQENYGTYGHNQGLPVSGY